MDDDIVFAATMSFARSRFDQLAEGVRASLRAIPPSGNHEGTQNLYQDYRRDMEGGCPEFASWAWRTTLFDILRPTLASISLAEKRLLYLATDNGGMEYAAAEQADEIFCVGPWIEEEVIRRVSQAR
jgi:hypothetical protein